MAKTKIAILGVLHSFHEQVPCYSLNILKEVLTKISPDLILAELKQSEILSNLDQPFKMEYGVILPFAAGRNIEVVGMDPEEPQFSEMVDPFIDNQGHFKSNFPTEFKVLSEYQKQLFEFLVIEHWDSVSKTQSEITNTLFNLKHRLQNELMGPAEEQGWELFNNYYANKIEETVKFNAGKKILVTIGIEHVYWLKERFKGDTNVEVLDLDKYLA